MQHFQSLKYLPVLAIQNIAYIISYFSIFGYLHSVLIFIVFNKIEFYCSRYFIVWIAILKLYYLLLLLIYPIIALYRDLNSLKYWEILFHSTFSLYYLLMDSEICFQNIFRLNEHYYDFNCLMKYQNYFDNCSEAVIN